MCKNKSFRLKNPCKCTHKWQYNRAEKLTTCINTVFTEKGQLSYILYLWYNKQVLGTQSHHCSKQPQAQIILHFLTVQMCGSIHRWVTLGHMKSVQNSGSKLVTMPLDIITDKVPGGEPANKITQKNAKNK